MSKSLFLFVLCTMYYVLYTSYFLRLVTSTWQLITIQSLQYETYAATCVR